MPRSATTARPSRGFKKKERTRELLIDAGLQVLADRGEALTISDVVAQARVSNGTFYNYFATRDDLIDALAERSMLTLTAELAHQTEADDPATRFAFATAAILSRALDDPTWGRVVLRLADHRHSLHHELSRYIRKDLEAGFEEGRFETGADPIMLDCLLGLNQMAIRRIVRGEASPDYVRDVVTRALTLLGIPAREARKLAASVSPSKGDGPIPTRRS
jgi:AcrR family transcriptional regulator